MPSLILEGGSLPVYLGRAHPSVQMSSVEMPTASWKEIVGQGMSLKMKEPGTKSLLE